MSRPLAVIKNPILGLASFQKLQALTPEAKTALIDILGELAIEYRDLAEKNWRSHKAPMAAYWKAASVYAGHIRKALKRC